MSDTDPLAKLRAEKLAESLDPWEEPSPRIKLAVPFKLKDKRIITDIEIRPMDGFVEKEMSSAKDAGIPARARSLLTTMSMCTAALLVSDGTEIRRPARDSCQEETTFFNSYLELMPFANVPLIYIRLRQITAHIEGVRSGHLFEDKFTCINRLCDHSQAFQKDLRTYEVVYAADNIQDEYSFKFTFRKQDYTATWRTLIVKDYVDMLRLKADHVDNVTMVLALSLITLNGKPVDNLDAIQALPSAVRTQLASETEIGGVNAFTDIECPKCHTITTCELPWRDRDFFFPCSPSAGARKSSSKKRMSL